MLRLSDQIVGLLGASSAPAEALAHFDGWVVARTERVRSAAAAGQPGLRLELERLSAELMTLRSQAPLATRLSKVLWLEGLIALVSEVAPLAPEELQPAA